MPAYFLLPVLKKIKQKNFDHKSRCEEFKIICKWYEEFKIICIQVVRGASFKV